MSGYCPFYVPFVNVEIWPSSVFIVCVYVRVRAVCKCRDVAFLFLLCVFMSGY